MAGRPADRFRVRTEFSDPEIDTVEQDELFGRRDLQAYMARWVPTLRGAWKSQEGLLIKVTVEKFDRDRLRWKRDSYQEIRP